LAAERAAKAVSHDQARLRAMWRLVGGAVLAIAGIVAFIEAHTHRPDYDCRGAVSACELGEGVRLLPGHLTQTPYDGPYAAAWALVVLGVSVVVLGLIRHWRAGRASRRSS
jgi:hypothetical protein